MNLVRKASVYGVLAVFLVPAAAYSSLRTDLEALIKASGKNRTCATEGATKAFAWLKAEAAKIPGWQIEEQGFKPDVDFSIRTYKADFEKYVASGVPMDHPEVKKWRRFTDGVVKYQESLRGKPGTNLVLRKKGTNPKLAKEVLVVSAHYDTITHDHDTLEITPEREAPGADDNGAAVVALLQIARDLKDLKPARTLELVFFDYEEAFYLGSRAYAEEAAKKGLQPRNVNLEMIGWDKPLKNKVKIYARASGKPGSIGDMKLAKPVWDELKKVGLDPLVTRNNFDRSDNWSFWNALFPAITVSEDWEKNFNKAHYHRPSDTPDTLNWDFVEKITKAVSRSVRQLSAQP